ncbi:NlpC/P60 family protein [Streptomyces sp. NPDC048416]|uniref:C40 family peptidase n=1 Tax=Streptomyces sp. NPDC048416 TaxID=3365546 RepID=UPI0037150D73
MASHRRPSQSGLTQSARVTVLSAAAATAAAALAAPGASAAPHDPGSSAKATVDRLFEQAEQATEQYDKADEHAQQLRRQVGQAQDRVARGQEKINRMRGALGAIAGAQYRSGGIDPTLDLFLSSNPETYLDRAATLDRLSERQAGALDDLQHEQRRLAQQRAEASHTLVELEHSRAEVARHKRSVESKLAAARRLLNALPTADRAAFDRASRSGRTELPPLSGSAPASSRAAAAVMAARSAIGKPYIWGASGPAGFDCSGLMQWSYARAGVGLPRTSQEQRYAGHQVPLSEAKPGDLIAYRHDASHIAMYVGNGQVVHAPYPGAPVRYDPVGMMPISSVTRV